MRPRLLAALAMLLLAPAARAATRPHLEGIPAHIRAGAEICITWTGLGADVHEAELELSLAGGRWVRISPELEAREGGFSWHVPVGLSGPARLRLRYGGERFEAEGEVSTPFVIAPGNRGTVSVAPDRELGEWWCLGRDTGALPASQFSARPRSTGRSVARARARDRTFRSRRCHGREPRDGV
jgi:hypothetical protein